ncbi:MAG TPA: META domain-containing protein [Solirubrobacteraceae bacterium]|nr:META domain-containing protein [Solirubrobacteraceae bacterium]
MVLIGLAAVIGCGDEDDGDAAADAPSFEDVPWMLASGPSATFTDGTVAGSTGCNRFTASYTLEGDVLEISPAATTRMACEPPVAAAEREFLAALDRVAGWESAGGELVLSDADGNELLRFREPSPEGNWTATMFRQRDAVSSPLPETEVTAVFEDGTLTGSAGCNTYRATYTTDRGSITIGEPAATRKACAGPPGVMEQEQAYLSALPLAVGYRVEGSTLSLLTAEGTYVAIYASAP